MKRDEFRITAKIRTESGKEKTVTFNGNVANMRYKMKKEFEAVAYKIMKFGRVGFAATMPWESIETGERIE